MSPLHQQRNGANNLREVEGIKVLIQVSVTQTMFGSTQQLMFTQPMGTRRDNSPGTNAEDS